MKNNLNKISLNKLNLTNIFYFGINSIYLNNYKS